MKIKTKRLSSHRILHYQGFSVVERVMIHRIFGIRFKTTYEPVMTSKAKASGFEVFVKRFATPATADGWCKREVERINASIKQSKAKLA